jgi:sugar (glycoside-pentoside-hexuronide) transporter
VSSAAPALAAPRPAPEPSLGPFGKTVYAAGDLTLNTSLVALTMIYTTFFLIQIAELRPVLAGLVPMIGRVVDAFADPLMGRFSDRTTWRSGRRRPYFLLGAIPYGVTFALLWVDAPFDSTAARFAYYAAVYLVHALSMTVLSVPYLAILPEMALGYDARTSLNTYRTIGAIVGIFVAAVFLRPIANALGGGSEGYAAMGVVLGVALALPWLAVHRVTFERPAFRERPAALGFFEGLRLAWHHGTFQQLTAAFIMGRIAMDLVGALMILYMTWWIGRSEDFEPLMALFLTSVLLSLPFWLRVARGRDKAQLFVIGSLWWGLSSLLLVLAQPDWPRWLLFVWVPVIGLGYAVVDVMPWSMLGEVIDEDDVATGERREGLYTGFFTFLRKLGGSLGVFLVLGLIDAFGFVSGAEQQSPSALQAIRWLTALAPPVFLLLGVWLLRGYPLTRDRHAAILRALAARDDRTATTAGSGSRAG